MGHFYIRQKRQTPINYERPERKENSAKISLEKNLKGRWKENAKKKKKKTMKPPARV